MTALSIILSVWNQQLSILIQSASRVRWKNLHMLQHLVESYRQPTAHRMSNNRLREQRCWCKLSSLLSVGDVIITAVRYLPADDKRGWNSFFHIYLFNLATSQKRYCQSHCTFLREFWKDLIWGHYVARTLARFVWLLSNYFNWMNNSYKQMNH